eukprot:753067-Hanusia_phi.AAC.3
MVTGSVDAFHLRFHCKGEGAARVTWKIHVQQQQQLQSYEFSWLRHCVGSNWKYVIVIDRLLLPLSLWLSFICFILLSSSPSCQALVPCSFSPSCPPTLLLTSVAAPSFTDVSLDVCGAAASEAGAAARREAASGCVSWSESASI